MKSYQVKYAKQYNDRIVEVHNSVVDFMQSTFTEIIDYLKTNDFKIKMDGTFFAKNQKVIAGIIKKNKEQNRNIHAVFIDSANNSAVWYRVRVSCHIGEFLRYEDYYVKLHINTIDHIVTGDLDLNEQGFFTLEAKERQNQIDEWLELETRIDEMRERQQEIVRDQDLWKYKA